MERRSYLNDTSLNCSKNSIDSMELKFYCRLHKSTSLNAVEDTQTHTHTIYIYIYTYQVIGFINGAVDIYDMAPLL